jgi:hypothetical protein
MKASSLPIAEPPAAEITLSGVVQVYDPAMCCSTGVCGPAVDPNLLRIARDLRWLVAQGVTVERYGLAREPAAFTENPRIVGLLAALGERALPAVVVNGEVLAFGAYPSREELVGKLQGENDPARDAGPTGCGCGPGCC